jgi:hypothetical protein
MYVFTCPNGHQSYSSLSHARTCTHCPERAELVLAVVDLDQPITPAFNPTHPFLRAYVDGSVENFYGSRVAMSQ